MKKIFQNEYLKGILSVFVIACIANLVISHFLIKLVIVGTAGLFAYELYLFLKVKDIKTFLASKSKDVYRKILIKYKDFGFAD